MKPKRISKGIKMSDEARTAAEHTLRHSDNPMSRSQATALLAAYDRIAELEGASTASEIPCCKCSGQVIEFSVANGAWNKIVRNGGPEHDQEYLCVSCFAQKCVDYVESLTAELTAARAKCERLEETLDFLFSQFQTHSPQMDGQHSYRFRNGGWPMTHAKGNTIRVAIAAAMAEVQRSKEELSEKTGEA